LAQEKTKNITSVTIVIYINLATMRLSALSEWGFTRRANDESKGLDRQTIIAINGGVVPHPDDDFNSEILYNQICGHEGVKIK